LLEIEDKMTNHFSYTWLFKSSLTAEQVWPAISDTDFLIKSIGESSIKPMNLRFIERARISTEHFQSLDLSCKEKYQWEAPYHLSIKRTNTGGQFRHLYISIHLSDTSEGCDISIRIKGVSIGLTGRLIAYRSFSNRSRNRYVKSLASYGYATFIDSDYPVLKNKVLGHSDVRKRAVDKLVSANSDPDLSERLVSLLCSVDSRQLKKLYPIRLSKLWDRSLQDVLKVMFQASKLDILNHSWDVDCPSCRQTAENFNKLSGVSPTVTCKNCGHDFDADLHRSVHLTFSPHPSVRKVSDLTYALSNPSQNLNIRLKTFLEPDQIRIIKIDLKKGKYRITDSETNSITNIVIEQGGQSNASLIFFGEDTDTRNLSLSPNPNLILYNKGRSPLTIECEDLNQEVYHISPIEVTTQPTYCNLFPGELLQEKDQVSAKDLTVLFTDLSNSSDIYNRQGDESATGLVMTHFDILEAMVNTERGAIVKTNGDSIMALFPKPVYALRAFQKAQEVFKNQTETQRSILLKGGIHTGDCVAVILNNRIDYFGSTVNIASRLVEFANSEEVVISEDAYSCPELAEFLSDDGADLKVQHLNTNLKGFDDQVFEVKRISLRSSPLRLVV
jgi:adenylate cyclase